MAFSAEHPVREILTVSDGIDMDRIDICTEVIENNPSVVEAEPECDYLAQKGAIVLTVMANTLIAEGYEVNKENRKKIAGIAWDNLSFFEMTGMIWTAMDLSDSSIYMGKNHPDMVAKYLSDDMVELFKRGGIIKDAR